MPTVYIDGCISPEPGPGIVTAAQFREQLLAVAGAPAINVEINCDGGVCTEGMAMYSALRQFTGRKVGIVMGIAASMASVLLQGCDERRVAKGALVMIHEARGGVRNATPGDMRAQADVIDKEQAGLVDIYTARTGLLPAKIVELLAAETYMTAEEAVSLGFADAVETFGASIAYPAVARLRRDTSALGKKVFAEVRKMRTVLALSATPATGTSKGNTMDPALLKKIMDVIASQDPDAALALLPEIITGVAAEESAEGDPAEGTPPTAAGEPAATPPKDPQTPLAPSASAADAPATAMLLRITGAKSLADAEPILRSAITSMRTVETDRNAVTMNARRELCVQLIEAGGETPATCWEGKPEDRMPKARLLAESLEDMRARVTALKARNGGGGHTPPASGGGAGRVFTTSQGEVTLTASEIKNCEASGAKLEAYAENKAIREAARGSRKDK